MNTSTAPTAVVDHLAITTSPSSRRRDLRLAVRQIGFEQRAFWRNRTRAFFSVGLPLMFLVVFNALNGSHHIDELGGITYATWFVPGILAYGLMMATFSNLAVSITVARDTGVLKRLRGTSLPTWVYIAGRVGSTVITAATLVAATLGLDIIIYGVHIRLATLPGLLATLVLGAKICPVRAFAYGLQHAFHPATTGSGIVGTDLVVLAIWTLVGLRICQRWFRWETRH